MIIVTVKKGPNFYINDKEILKIEHERKKERVFVFYKGLTQADLIDNVVSVQFISDATPATEISKSQIWDDMERKALYHEFELEKEKNLRDYFKHQFILSFDSINDIIRICDNKEINHKQARTQISTISKQFQEAAVKILDEFDRKQKLEKFGLKENDTTD